MKALPFEEKVEAFMDTAREWPPRSMEIERELAEYKAMNLENTADAVITEIRTERTGYRAESLYPDIKCPCLIMLGNPELGGLVDHKDRERLASLLRQASIKEFDDAGHGFFYYHRPAYRPEQAMDGWDKIWDFFGRHLST